MLSCIGLILVRFRREDQQVGEDQQVFEVRLVVSLKVNDEERATPKVMKALLEYVKWVRLGKGQEKEGIFRVSSRVEGAIVRWKSGYQE